MIIHLYAQCWNDAWMLPFFFDHYDSMVDRYFIYDDGSTDATWQLLEDHPKVEARRFSRSHPHSFVLSEQAFSNSCWKASRGKADWVIVTDIDEHLYHSDWYGYLARCRSAGETLVPALGFQMISETMPHKGEILSQAYSMGAPWVKMMKPSIFDPAAIVEMNFRTGRHSAEPEGEIRVPRRDELMLFHYKYLSFTRTHHRHQLLQQGLKSLDLEKGWGYKYFWDKAQFRADWNKIATSAVDTLLIRDDPEWRYPIPRWWEKYRN